MGILTQRKVMDNQPNPSNTSANQCSKAPSNNESQYVGGRSQRSKSCKDGCKLKLGLRLSTNASVTEQGALPSEPRSSNARGSQLCESQDAAANDIMPYINHPTSVYVVDKYALPNSLRAVKKWRDPQDLMLRRKLDAWHTEKIKHLVGWNMSRESCEAGEKHAASQILKQKRALKKIV